MNRVQDNLEVVRPSSRAEWRKRLSKNYTQKKSVWPLIAKVNYSGIKLLEAAEELLCFGWIDSVPNKLDEKYCKLLVSPRKSKSV